MTQREKLIKIMESEQMNAKQFAEETGIQAGTISNIINGRNNPSLDVIQRVLNRFRSISTDWLVMDFGPMYRSNGSQAFEQSLFDLKPLEQNPSIPTTSQSNNEPSQGAPLLHLKGATIQTNEQPREAARKRIERIVIFFDDGTFEER